MTKTLIYPISYLPLSLLKFLFSLNLKFILILNVIFIILLLGFYIFQTATLISQGYQIQNYQNKLNKISEENKNLEINFMKINSLENIDKKIQELGFERIDKVYYIQILESSVVTTK